MENELYVETKPATRKQTAAANIILMVDTEIEAAPLLTANGRKGKLAAAGRGEQPSEDSMQFMLLGADISHLKRDRQFVLCAVGLFSFSLLYGYLQELISVKLFSRDLALFLSTVQFSGYTLLVVLLRKYVYPQTDKKVDGSNGVPDIKKVKEVPPYYYLAIALLRAFELGLTNVAMQYINYPAKTLLKSSRVVFTMMLGMLFYRKKYKTVDCVPVFGMVAGLALFLRADSKSAAIFHYGGVILLLMSLLCDGAIVNISEIIMTKYGVGQDEVRTTNVASGVYVLCCALAGSNGMSCFSCLTRIFGVRYHASIFAYFCCMRFMQFIFRVYSIALIAVTIAATLRGDLDQGCLWMSEPGTYKEFVDNVPMADRTWSVAGKIAILFVFSATGFFALSCCSAITKNFGALTMSVTSTSRKAATLFLSFFLFDNVFTTGHMIGVVVFVGSLLAKATLRRDADLLRRKRPIKRKFSDATLNKKGNRKPPLAGTTGNGTTEGDHLTLRHGAAATS